MKKDKEKNKKQTIKYSELPTKERLNQNGGVTYETVEKNNQGEKIAIRSKAAESHVLDWYKNKKSITGQMHRAGLKFHECFINAGKMPNTTIMFRERTQGSGMSSEDQFNAYLHAQEQYKQAMVVLTPPERDVIFEVAGLSNHAGNNRVQYLKTGLRALAAHWAIPVEVDANK